jgi:Domain of unknown function (DUF4157)
MRRHDGTTENHGPAALPPTPVRPDAATARALIAQRLADPEAVLGAQRSAGNAAVVQLLAEADEAETHEAEAPSPVLDVVGHGGGQPLDDRTRRGMELALGTDLSDVRIHNDAAASASASAVQAHAYTVGNDVVFGSGLYRPDSPDGQHMLAHELTHVVQQRSGPVEGTPTGDGVAVSDPSDRFEQAAETNAERIMSAGGLDAHLPSAHDHAEAGGPSAGETASAGTAQRDAASEEEEPVQGAWVQRAGAGPEEEEEPVQGWWVQREAAPEEEEDKQS